MSDKNIITLYHGSKSGIKGDIAPLSREKCDFGKGFYMDTEKTQPLTLICNYETAKIYTLEFDMTDVTSSPTLEVGEFLLKIVKKGGTVFSREVMYWTDYVYRYWHYYTGESSKEIYNTADAVLMNDCWLGFHTLDVEMAIDRLKEIKSL